MTSCLCLGGCAGTTTYIMWDESTESYSGQITLCTLCEALLDRKPTLREKMYEQNTLRWQDGKTPAVVERIEPNIELAAVA